MRLVPVPFRIECDVVNEVAVESKQLRQARLLGRCLAGLLATNVLMVGIAFWTSWSQASMEAEGVAETRQPGPAPTVREANGVVATMAVPAKADSPPATQAVTNNPKMAAAGAQAPRATSSSSKPATAAGEKTLPTKPARSGMQTSIASPKPLLETASAAIALHASIPPTSKAQENSDQETHAQTKNITPSVVRLVNPIANGGDVHYVVNKVPFSLSPGEYHELSQTAECLVEFHRGGDFGNAEVQLQTGDYVFAIGETGWNLARGQMEPAATLRQAH